MNYISKDKYQSGAYVTKDKRNNHTEKVTIKCAFPALEVQGEKVSLDKI